MHPTEARFYRIKGWSRFQHYKDRNPPWIKLHRELISSRTWVALDDASRVLAIASMMLAAACDNLIPVDPLYLKRVAYLNSDPDLSTLHRVDFIEFIDENGSVIKTASALLATCLQLARPETEQSRAETEKIIPPVQRKKRAEEDFSPEFDQAWAIYPKRDGSNPKRDAWKAWSARLLAGYPAEEMIAGTRRYAAHLESHGKIGTEFVMQAVRFYGKSLFFRDGYTAAVNGSGNSQRKLVL